MRRAFVAITVVLVSFASFAQQSEPTDAQGWFERGVKLHDAGQFRPAAEAFEKARSMGFAARPIVNTRIARAYARAGDTDKALKLLETMAKNGFGPPTTLLAEDDLVPLRSDARWKAVIEIGRAHV